MISLKHHSSTSKMEDDSFLLDRAWIASAKCDVGVNKLIHCSIFGHASDMALEVAKYLQNYCHFHQLQLYFVFSIN